MEHFDPFLVDRAILARPGVRATIERRAIVPLPFVRAVKQGEQEREAMSPNEAISQLSESFVHKRLFGAAKGFLTTGTLGGTIEGFAGGGGGGGSRRMRKAQQAIRLTEEKRRGRKTAADFVSTSLGPCQPPFVPGPGGVGCVAVTVQDLTPGVTTPAEGDFQVTSGAFGMPAVQPKHEFIGRFKCPEGMVLGQDELCYPKQILRRDSRFRKWRPGTRPVMTGGERAAIRKARRAITRTRDAIADIGITVKKK